MALKTQVKSSTESGKWIGNPSLGKMNTIGRMLIAGFFFLLAGGWGGVWGVWIGWGFSPGF